MIVNVNQRMWTLFGRKYIVSIDGEKKYEIERRAFSAKGVYEIKDYDTLKEVGIFRNKLMSLKADTEIIIGEKEFHFKQESVKSMKYFCENINAPEEKYLIQAHHGHTTSIFKNQNQVAWWDKKRFVILEGNKYKIEMNFDEDPILFSAFAVLVDNYRISITIGGDIGWEMGNMGKGLTNRNENWKRKKNS